ncbi:hypothetical protein BJY01DRAFT_179628 [Aspergillus pseudoustus]|uniref:Uncharacterized protein n=1 Tax=Aspergillus pseudoustus TaxID=1810923 RepID=A0ABR4KW77_9EURO
MTLGLLDLCRDKLYTQIASSNLNLRVLVGHSNLLDALVNDFNENPEFYNYAADDNAMCGADDDAAKSQGTDGILPAYPRQENTTTGEYTAGRIFPTTDSVFSRYGVDEDTEDDGVSWDSDSDDDEDPVFSSPPVLTVRNPDPDLDLHTVEHGAIRNILASHALETIYEEDTAPLDPTSTSRTMYHSSTLGMLPSTPSVSKRPTISVNSDLSPKRPLLSGVKEILWWTGGNFVSAPLCV